MLRTLVERAGMKQLLEDSAAARSGAKLAAVPVDVQHIALERFHERPVQAMLVVVSHSSYGLSQKVAKRLTKLTATSWGTLSYHKKIDNGTYLEFKFF